MPRRRSKIEPMGEKKGTRLGRPSDGILRRPMNMNLPVELINRVKAYTEQYGEPAANLVARLLAEFFRTDGKPPGNVRSTLKSKLEQLE